MKTIRKGNDIVVRWRIFRYGQKYDIALYRESISLVLSNMGEKKEITDYSIVDVNTIVFKYRAEDQGLGIYRLLLIDKSRNSTRIIEECNAFRLVNTSDAANNDDTLESAITITLTSELTAPADGLSAYEVALQNGFIGTEEEWLQSLKGEQGPQGIQGDKGDKGDRGEQGDKGLSAYQVAIANGFVGTEAEWLQSLVPDTTDIELAEAQRQAKELERIEAENARKSAELERQNASTEAVASANEAASNANEAAITAQQKAGEANTAASSANAVVEGFNSIIVQEKGNLQDKVMSQKAVTDALTASDEKLSELDGKITDLDFYKMKLTPNFLNFNVSNLFNVLDYEGFKANPEVWPIFEGGFITPKISIEEQNNPLGLKYSRCFTVTDKLYNDKHYDSPYFILRLPALKGVKTKSFCFYVNLKYLDGRNKIIYSSFDGLNYPVQTVVKWGTDTHRKVSKSVLGTTSYLSIDIIYFEFNGEKWAFVKGKFGVDDISVVQDKIPSFTMQFVGGEEHVGEKTVTCGWTFVAGDYDLLPFQYYPHNKNFFELFTEQSVQDGSITTDKIKDNAITQQKIESGVNLSVTTLSNGLYGQVGDSISEGVGLQTLLDTEDIYNPISGIRKATYGYYIAKLNRMRWANYGISGSTLGFVVANGSDKNGFSKENGRYTQMDDNLTHISIFFGWNDAFYGPIMKKEEWLFNTYNTKIYYPRTEDLIGTIADDGTPYATQEQYNALNEVTGNVGGIEYNNSRLYFRALYVGTKNDSTNKTFWGAWNIVLPYLINKYPLAKILLVVPFGCTSLLRQCVRDAAKKYGLATYDFSDINNQLFRQWEDNPADGMVNGKSISQFRIDNLTYDGLHPNENGYKYMYPSINAKLMSL